jgi:hypothetical protein
MTFVAIAALDFGAIRVWYQHLPYNDADTVWVETLAFGGRPMANLLAVGIMVGLRHPQARPFLWGFATFGGLASALFGVLAYFYTLEVIQPFLVWFFELESVETAIRGFRRDARDLIQYFIGTLLLGLPQLAFALSGGLLTRKFRIAERPDQPRW